MLLGGLFAAAVLCSASLSQAADEGLSRETVDTYLFLPDSKAYLIGDRTYRWESDLIVMLFREDERALIEDLVDRLHDSGLGDRRIFLLPAMEEVVQGGYDTPTLEIIINTEHFEHMLAPGALAGLEAYQDHAKQMGCYALAQVPYLKTGDYIIQRAQIVARDTLSPRALEDCLFRGLLINLGLMYSPTLAFDDEPMTEEARADALGVLRALYDPAIDPGLSREDFFDALVRHGYLSAQ